VQPLGSAQPGRLGPLHHAQPGQLPGGRGTAPLVVRQQGHLVPLGQQPGPLVRHPGLADVLAVAGRGDQQQPHSLTVSAVRGAAAGFRNSARRNDRWYTVAGMCPELSVVVVTYNSAHVVGELLDSLPAALGGVSADVVVVDNGSTDGTVELLAARADCR